MSNTWVELDLGRLRGNMASLRATLRDSTEIVFVVKADAYGHGMRHIAGFASACGLEWFAVAQMAEAVVLRSMLPGAKIVMMGIATAEDVPALIAHDLIPIVVSAEHGRVVSEIALAAGRRVRCHVKVDTGMGRLGLRWESARAEISQLSGLEGIELAGLCSHFASSEDSDDRFARLQAERFMKLISDCAADGVTFSFKHISNSGGLLLGPQWEFDGVRPGLLLYGYNPVQPARTGDDRGSRGVATDRVLQWKTRVIQVKKVLAGNSVGYGCTYRTVADTNLAVVDAGYSDGYPRSLSNRSPVLAGGRRVQVAGRISMNFLTVDLGERTAVRPGDEVVLIGEQGGESIWADELAELAGTIPYEILTGIRTNDRRVV